MGRRGPPIHPLYDRVMAMLRAGEVAHLRELAVLAGVSAQRIGQWCEAEGLDWRARRKAKLDALWPRMKRRERMKAKGVTPTRRSKAQLRAEAERLVAEHKRKPAS